MDRQYCVYILASGTYGTLYIGVTNDLVRRVWEHKNDVVKGFSNEHATHRLVGMRSMKPRMTRLRGKSS